MPSFLPGLRGQGLAPREAKAMQVAFSSYYSDLNQAYNQHRRARPWPIERAVVEGYERVIWVFKSVNTIGADLSRLPFEVREGHDLDSPVVEDHPLARLLNGKANPLESGAIFRKRLSAQILLSKKGAFVEVTKSNGGTLKRLDLLPPDRTEIIPGTGADLIDHIRLTKRDGSYKNIDPEKVRWFRDPHPTDPFSGVTPLEAAGLSVELDHFARLYNVSFMANDGRPGGILAVRDTKGGGDIAPAQQDRIEQRFAKGPVEAGKLSVIAGDLSYVDLAAKPRDMSYGETSKNSKIEILEAFGVSDVVLGYAADRTFSNADAELYNYWTRTIPGHADVMLTGFSEDSDEGHVGAFDTSTVEVLEKAARERRAEAREEVAAGLRSPYSYAVLAKYDDEIEETPYTRALYIASGKTPLPAKQEDAEALGLATPTAEPGADPNAPAPPGASATQVPNPPAGAVPGAPTPPALTAGPPAAAGAPAAPAGPSGAARAALDAIVAGRKALPAGGGSDPKVLTLTYRVSRKESSASRATRTSDPNLDATDAFEEAIAAALTALTERWVERTVARLGSPKQRKGTRHFVPEYTLDTRVGTKALDAANAVDEQTWQSEAEQHTHPILTAAAVAAAVALLADFAVQPPPGLSMAEWAARLVAQTTYEVVTGIGRAALTQANTLTAYVNTADQRGDSMEDIVAAVRERGSRLGSWARGVATQAATATVGGARDSAADAAAAVTPAAEVDRVWFSRRDAAVRETHNRSSGCDGQVRGLTEPFLVGTALLMRPGDPHGPLRETANCRCFLRHRMRASGRWTIAPDGKALPRDGDGDGRVYDGTLRERPVTPRLPRRRAGSTDMTRDNQWREGYAAAAGRFADVSPADREEYARQIDTMLHQEEFGSSKYRLLTGMAAYLTEHHEPAQAAEMGVQVHRKPATRDPAPKPPVRRAGLKALPSVEAAPATLQHFAWSPEWESPQAEWLWTARDRIERQTDYELHHVPGLDGILRGVIGSKVTRTGAMGGNDANLLGVTQGSDITYNHVGFTWAAATFNSGKSQSPGWFTLNTKSIEEVARYVSVHELGHVIANTITDAHKAEIVRAGVAVTPGLLVSEPDPETVSLDAATLKASLSAYGATNWQEMLAEAWAEYRLANRPRPFALTVGRLMEEHLGERQVVNGHAAAVAPIHLGDPDDIPDDEPIVWDLSNMGSADCLP